MKRAFVVTIVGLMRSQADKFKLFIFNALFMKRFSLFIFLIVSIVVLTGEHCTRDCYNDYKFTVPFTLYPAKDTFRVGDTIWVESHIPTMLYDSISGQEYSFGDFEHKIYGSLNIYDNPEQWLSGSSNFDYTGITGSCIRYKHGGGTTFRFFYKKNSDGSDSLKLAFVPQQKGLYDFSAYTFSLDYYAEKGIITKSCTESIYMYFRTNDADSLNNYRLLIGHPNITPTEKGFLRFGGYAFRVVE